MSGSVNKVILVANLGADPECRSLPDGRPVVNLRVATSESWRDKSSGERRERTEWHRVQIFNENICKVAEQYLRKGSKVYIEGQIQTRKYTDQQGNERFITEIVIQPFKGELTMLDPKGSDERETASGGYEIGSDRDPNAPPRQSISERAAPGGPAPSRTTALDDEVPFNPQVL